MHAVLTTFDLIDMTMERYAEVSAELAPSFAALPGLLSKIWLADPIDGRHGGFYLFGDKAYAEGFMSSALARSVALNPHFDNLTVQHFSVDETNTALTQPGVTIVSAPAAV